MYIKNHILSQCYYQEIYNREKVILTKERSTINNVENVITQKKKEKQKDKTYKKKKKNKRN